MMISKVIEDLTKILDEVGDLPFNGDDENGWFSIDSVLVRDDSGYYYNLPSTGTKNYCRTGKPFCVVAE